MSGSLYYMFPAKKNYVDCSPAFRDAVANRGDLTSSDVPYLEGWRDAGEKAAEKLIDLINDHDVILVSIEY